jgi:hypothetical protein
MSGMSTTSTAATEVSQRWAALDKQNERVVDPAHPLLAELRRDRSDVDRILPAAS